MFDAINHWIPVFLPILGIGVGIMTATALLGKISAIFGISEIDRLNQKRKQRDEDSIQLLTREIMLGGQTLDDEKPKRQSEPEFILRDDGELLEVIDDKPKRGLHNDG